MTQERLAFLFMSVMYDLQVTLGLSPEEAADLIKEMALNIIEEGPVRLTAKGIAEFEHLVEQGKTSISAL